MEYYIARLPVFNRNNDLYGYRLILCPSLRAHFYDLYREPDDAEALYRQLCFVGYADAQLMPTVIMEFTEEMFESLVPLLPRQHVIVAFSDNVQLHLNNMTKIKTQGYGVAYDATADETDSLQSGTDIVCIDFSAMSSERQLALIKTGKKQVKFLAYNIETWDDWKKAQDIGYDYCQGAYYTKMQPGTPRSIRTINTAVLSVISELNRPAPSYRAITNIIEHDLNLSYRVLKLVNSAYIAPKFQVKTIAQAVTILGLNEMTKFMSTLLLYDVRDARNLGNKELLRCSLVRGKLMELLADERKIHQKGSEAFFTGIFSLIDVLLNREMAGILSELPLTDGVKGALLGETSQLRALLELVVDYEQAHWGSFTEGYRFSLAEQEKLMNLYMAALRWAESMEI